MKNFKVDKTITVDKDEGRYLGSGWISRVGPSP